MIKKENIEKLLDYFEGGKDSFEERSSIFHAAHSHPELLRLGPDFIKEMLENFKPQLIYPNGFMGLHFTDEEAEATVKFLNQHLAAFHIPGKTEFTFMAMGNALSNQINITMMKKGDSDKIGDTLVELMRKLKLVLKNPAQEAESEAAFDPVKFKMDLGFQLRKGAASSEMSLNDFSSLVKIASANAAINLVGKDSLKSALHFAITRGQYEKALILLSEGEADSNLLDRDRKKPLDYLPNINVVADASKQTVIELRHELEKREVKTEDYAVPNIFSP